MEIWFCLHQLRRVFFLPVDKKISNSIYTPSISLYTPLERWGENMGVCDMGCREKKIGCK